MSIGGLIGGVVGGIVGFFIGGPAGILYGAAIGFSLGLAIDPITPDVPVAGTPLPVGSQVMLSEIGGPLPDLVGTGQITGHLLCFGNERVETIMTEVPGGKGGGSPDPYVSGYKYYMSWAVGIVAGPVDKLYTIYRNEDVIWEGELNLPASGGQETIVIDGMGSAIFYFGTADQIANSKVGALIDDETFNSPYRHFCWCFFDDCYIGEFNRCPTMKFVLGKYPVIAFSAHNIIQTYDYNPMHTIWYALHDLAGLSESWLHTEDFAAAALTLANETRGICCLFTQQQNTLDYLESVNNHIDGIIRYGSDGKFHPKLIRDDYVVDDLPLIDENVMLEEPTLNRKSWIDTINEMKVQYTELIKPYGNLYGSGDNEYNQLGIDDFPIGSIDYVSVLAGSWSKIATGYLHSMAIKNDGTLWATGYNVDGQLGLGDNEYRYEFVQVGSDTDWDQIVCGSYYTFAIKLNGEVWATGFNDYGELGLGDTTERNTFTQVSITNFEKVACGYESTLIIKTDGTLWGAGDNSCGQLGMGAVGNVTTFTQIGSDTDHATVTCGELHSAIIKDDGSLYTTGYNPYGELGLGDDVDRNVFTLVGTGWNKVACSSYYTVAIKTDGTLWGAGDNDLGQIGLGATASADSFTQIGSDSDWTSIECGVDSTYVTKTNGEVWGTGSNQFGKLGIGNYDSKIKTLQKIDESWTLTSGGRYHHMALKSDGTIWAVGYGWRGQTGIGDRRMVTRLTLCNEKTWLAVDTWHNHTAAIRNDFTLWGTGYNCYNQLGLGSNKGTLIYGFIQISSDSWQQVACGYYHTAGLRKDTGILYGTGYNYHGQLGLGDNTQRDVLTQISSGWKFVAAGSHCTMAIKDDNTLWCTGRNSGAGAGQLGLGDSINRNVFTQAIGTDWKQVSIGACHAAAVRSDGTLWTTGNNARGQLGQGDTTFRNIWTQVGSDTNWDYAECGADHTLAVKTDSFLYSAGWNYYGQLGLADNTNRNVFTQISEGWKHDGFNGLAQFSGGHRHSLSLYDDLNLKSTGRNRVGQLAINTSGDATNRNEFGQIVQSVPNRGSDNWEFLVCGDDHTMAIKILEL